jgi:adenine deaminase
MGKGILSVSGNIVDVVKKEIFEGTIYIEGGKIVKIERRQQATGNRQQGNNKTMGYNYILPGLIDAHVHIESSMAIPSEFARAAVIHGTVATVSDPHEIANVLGIEGVRFMIQNGRKVNFKFYFGAPSCVPATPLETSGASFGLKETEELLKMPEIKYLSEMMNFPGVINNDKEVIGKIKLAKKYDKPIDGHAPGLRGEVLKKYIDAGISTDHECFSIDEAEEKIKLGMKILIREGSAAKNFDELIPLITKYPDSIMFCSDDRHPDDLIKGHINLPVKRAIKKGYNIIDIIRSCTYNPVKHYKLDAGILQEGDPADFIIVDDLRSFNILSTWIKGVKVADKGKTLINSIKETTPNIFNCEKITVKDIALPAHRSSLIAHHSLKVIEAIDGQLITKSILAKPKIKDNKIVSDPANDILKIVVVNRYSKHEALSTKHSIGFTKGFGFKHGAIASSIAHDSHNIIAVGVDDEDIVNAINLIIENKGGIAYFNSKFKIQNSKFSILSLPVAGIMSDRDIFQLAEDYKKITNDIKSLGTRFSSAFMTLSFMALIVIPALKICDKGLFDVSKFEFTGLLV